MSSKRRRGDAKDLFAPEPEDTSMQATADRGYGTVEFSADRQRVSVKLIPIEEIAPDVTQPRRAVPYAVRHKWQNDEHVDIFEVWRGMVEVERQKQKKDHPFDLLLYLNEADFDRPEDCGPLEDSLLDLIALAASIRRDGLTNPVTVVRHGRQYTLETGERRWMAFHLLNSRVSDEDKDYSKIPARVVDEHSVWRQAAENNARDDLNAIGMARQLSVLIMDILRHEGYQFDSYQTILDAGFDEHRYYAQVADGNDFPIPKGRTEQVLNAMGFKSNSQLRKFRALLRIPGFLWEVADDLGWSERTIRNLIESANGDEELLRTLVGQQAATENYSVPWGTPDEVSGPETENEADKIYAAFERHITRWRRQFSALDSKRRRMLIQELHKLIDDLNQQVNKP